MVSRPTWVGGLGFSMKWNMGWMNDTLDYMAHDPVYRRYCHERLTFGQLYAYSENFVLPLSHDEVVHGKSSLLGKMPGDEWQRFANLRLLLAYQMLAPGKKLQFMGAELGQPWEWRAGEELPWQLLQYPLHAGVKSLVRELNLLYRGEAALHELDFSPDGFQWIDCHDADQSVISWLRRSRDGRHAVVVLNFTPVPRHGYRLGVPQAQRRPGQWRPSQRRGASLDGLPRFAVADFAAARGAGTPSGLRAPVRRSGAETPFRQQAVDLGFGLDPVFQRISRRKTAPFGDVIGRHFNVVPTLFLRHARPLLGSHT
jgi:1,4-alpha-glucan branching enzyme